jgi:ELWxxDGT repeat protein
MRLFFISIFLLLAINISAQSCPAGSYGSTSCTSCPTGIYTTGSATGSISVSACTICAPGYAGTVTDSGTSSASGCSICSAGSYSAAGASTCYSCNMGSYSSTGASMCTPCPLGFYTTGFGSTSVSQCSVCAQGYAGTGLSLSHPSSEYALLGCTICPPGKYSWNNAALCTSCPVGIYTADSGSVSVGFCSICAPGYAGIIYYAATTRATGCSICAAGSYAPAGPSGETSCATCPAGTFSSAAGSPVCESCPVGSYSSTGATSCSLCPTGIYTTNSATESTSISACTICAPGYAGTVTNSGTLNAAGCSICPPGSYASAGSTSCTSCPTGVYTTGSSSGNTSIVACTICAPGFAGLITFPGTLFVSGCSRCVAGSYSPAGAISCTTCHSGSYSNSGATSCTLCPSGIYTTGSATGSISVSACTICAPGYAGTVTNSGTLNAAGCVICSSGSYSSAGSLTCQFCATNTYSYSGASSCSSCLPGSTFISSSLGCRPSSAASSSPIDTSFYLSGSQIEGLAAFSNIINSNGLTHYSSSTSYPYEALVVSSGSYVSTPLLSSLPTGSSAFTVSSWVKCDASSLTDSNPSGVVVSWGSSQSSTSTSLTAATLAVTYAGRLSSPIVTVSTIAGGSSRGFVDGTNARFNYANGIAVDAANNVYVADSSNYVIRKITSSGFVSTFSGSGIQGLLDGTRTLARFSNINGIAVDANENIYVTESHSIRKINASGFVTTLAGGLSWGKLDGTGTNAQFYLPYGVAVDINGTVYVADTSNHLIRKITSSGNVTTVAGSRRGFADGAGTEAKFDVPTGVTVDISGNLYIADSNSPRIRKISSSGAVTTIAGNGRFEFADGIGTNAMFKYPYGITIDATGNIYVTDQSIFRIRKITLAGVVTTLAGSGLAGFQDGAGQNAKFKYFSGISADISGNIYVGDVERVRKLSLTPTLPGPLPVCDSTWHHIALTYSGSASSNTLTAYVDGSIISSTSATFAISSSSSSTLRIGWNGNSIDKELFSGSISDIRVFSRSMTSNEIVTLSQPLLSSGMEAVNPSPIRSSTSYTWYCSSGLYGPNITLTRSTSDGSWLTSGTVNCQVCAVNTFSYGSSSCSTCPTGSTFISSSLGCRPSSSTSAGPIDTSFYFSGSQLEGLSAFTNITSPSGITYTSDAFGVANAAISLSSGSYLSIPGSSSPSTLPSGGNIEWTVSAWVKCPAPNSWASVIEWGEVGKGWNSLRKSASIVLGGVREPVKFRSIFGGFYQPNDVHVDTFGNIYVADMNNDEIKKISVDGTVYSVISSGLLRPVGLVMDKDGNFYVTDQNGVKKIFSNGTILTLLDSTPYSTSGFYLPQGIFIDKEGNIYVTDLRYNCAIRKIHTNGTISLIGGGFSTPFGVFVDDFASVFVADTGNHAIKKVLPNGTIITLLDSGLYYPRDIYVDVFGTVWLVDTGNNAIKTIALDGTVTLISINGLFSPVGIYFDISGNLYIADSGSNSIKVFIYYSFLPVCDCTWHHVSLSYSPTSSLLSSYIDGVLDSQSKNINVTLPSPSFSNLRIGWNGNTSENFGNLRTLSISDLRIYNRTLSSSEIVTLSQPFLPTYSNVVNPTPVAGSSSYSWSCLAGWYGPIQTLNRNWSSGSWLSSGSINCQVCGANTFSYGGSSCSTCPSGSTFISSSLGCRPSSSTSAGPIDTSFYFSGSQLEGLSAFTNITSPSGITYTSDAFGVANAAISLSSGSYLSIPGSSSPSTLPSGGNIEWTVSAWVKCPAQSSLASSVIEWGDFERGWASTDGNVALLVGGTGGLASLGMIGGLLKFPQGIFLDSEYNIYIADTGNNAIKKLSSRGIITTILDTGLSSPSGVVVNADGTVFITDTGNNCIKMISKDGIVSTFASVLNGPTGITIDSSGSVYFADTYAGSIKVIYPNMTLATIFTRTYPQGVVVDNSNNVYALLNQEVIKLNTVSGVATTLLNGLYSPRGLAIDTFGTLYIVETFKNLVYKITSNGMVTTIKLKGVNWPYGIAVDSVGNLLLSDTSNHAIKKFSPTGSETVLLHSFVNSLNSVAVDDSGNVYVNDYIYETSNIHSIKKIKPSGQVITIPDIKLNQPSGITVDKSGNVFVADNYAIIKKISLSGIVSTIRSSFSYTIGLAIDGSGNLYVLNGDVLVKMFPNGTESRSQSITNTHPQRFSVDVNGNVYFAHNTIRKLSSTDWSSVTILADGMNQPEVLAVDLYGNVYVAENHAIKKITPSGTITSIVTSGLTNPRGVAVDSSGSILYVVDSFNPAIKSYTLNSYVPICDSTWHHISLSYAPSLSLLSAYVDGTLVSQRSSNVTLPSPSLSSLRVGWNGKANRNNGNIYSGTISDLRIYNRTLSSSEIVTLSQPFLPTYSDAVNPTPIANSSSYLWSCIAGSNNGPTLTLARSSFDGSWSFSGSINCPSPTASATTSPSSTSSMSAEASSSTSSSVTGTISASQSSIPTWSSTSSRSGSVSSLPTFSRSTSSSPTSTRSTTASASSTRSSSSTGTPSVTITTTSSPSVTRTSTSSPSATRSGSVTVSTTQSSSSTGTPSRSGSTTSSPSVTRTSTSSPSATRSGSVTVSTTQSSLSTGTPSRSGSTTSSPSVTRTSTSSPSATRSGSVTATSSRSGSTSSSPSVTRSTTLTSSVTSTGSATPSTTHSDSSSLSPSVTITTSSSLSVTRTSTSSPSATQSVTVTSSSTRSSSVTRSSSASPTSSRLSSISMSSTPTSTITTSATSTSSSSPTATISTSSTPIYSLTTEGPVMLLDINPGSYDSNPGLFTVFNNKLYFQARGIDTGIELWSSDGTSDGTFLLKDIYSGSGSGFPSFFTVFNNKLYFAAQDTSSGFELWSTDGTALGTTIVKDIWSGSSSSWPTYLTVLNEKLYFWANDGISGTELFSYDGTSDISIVKDIFPGSSMNNPLAVFNNKLYFAARDTSSGYELWCSDGTDSGTLMVKDIWSGSSSSNPSGFTVFNNKLFFQAAVSASGVELYSSDGTDSGTLMVKDIWSGSSSSNPSSFTVFNNKLFFQAAVSASGVELYSSDGTDSGTLMVKDIWSGSSSSNPSSFTVFNNKLFFQAAVSASGVELYSSDGTDSGTIMVKDIWSGSSSSNPSGFIVFNDKLFFKATDGYNGNELWVLSTLLISSSTSSGTATITPTATSTSSSSPTATISTSVTPTETTINISIISNIATNTPSSTSSGTATITPTATSTSSSSPTATISNSVTSTETTINISIISNIATNTPSSTSSGTATITPTISTLASISSAVSLTSSRTPFSSPSSTISSSDSAISTASTSASKSAAGTNVTLTSSATSSATATSTAVTISICSPGSFLQSSSSQCIPCAVNTYSYSGASSCSTCPSGSTFISSSLGCRPSSSTSAGPIDTSFYLSGSQTEGLSAFSNIINSNGFTYYTSSTTFPSTALVISSGSYLSTPLLSSLPIDSSAFSLSSWVKCDASSLTDSNPSGVVVSWGSVGESSTSTNLTAVTLAVTSTFRNRGVSTVSTIAGSSTQGFFDAVGTLSTFFNPSGLAIDVSSGSLYIADSNNRRIRKITSTGDATTIAGSGVAGYLDGIGTNARFSNPQGVAFDPSSSIVYVADTNNNRIRVITLSTGVVTTLAGSGQQGFADGLGISAVFSRPYGIAVDKTSGNIFICDRNNHRIRKITPNGLVSTLAGGLFASFADGTGSNAKFNYPQGIVLDASDENLYVTDSDNQRIRKVSTLTGIVKTVAGSGSAGDSDGLGTDATFRSPSGITLDKVGNLYVTDSNNLVRKIDVLTGMVTSIAGISGVADFADGSSTTAMFNNPQGIVVSSTGKDIYLTDTNNHRIRLITTIPNLPGPLPVCDSTWHNIALSYYTTISTAIRRLVNSSGGSSSGALTAYIDGINFASIPATYSISSSSSSSTFRIGSNGLSNGELFSGSLSDLRIYNRPLSENELKSLSTRPSSFPIPNTINNNYESTSSSSSVFIIIGAIVGVVILSGGGFGYYYNQRRKLLKKEKEEEEEISLKVVKIDSSSKEKDGDVRVNVDDTTKTSTNNWYSTPQTMTSTPLSNISSTSISLASSRVTAYEEKNESTTGMTSPESNNSFLKSSSENLQSSESQKKNNKTNSTTKSPTSDEDVDDDLILATKREFPEDDDDDDDDAILPGRIKDGESEELNLTGLMSAVEGTAVGEAAGSLLTTASSALEGLALASVSIPLVGLALKGLSMVCNQVEAFSRSNLEAEKLLGRLTRLQTVVQKAATDIDFCNEHSGIFDYMVKTLNKAADKLEVISKRSKLGKFVFAQSDLDIMERVDRAIMMHLTELQAAMQAQTLNMVKALHDGMLERSNKEDEIKAPPLPPFSMRFKQSDIIFDPPLEKQLVNAPRGSFGVVVFGIWKAHNLPCAVKMISSRTATGVVAVSMMSWLSEAELMRRLREHLNSVTRQTPQNICTLFGIGAVESPKTGEVTQYMVVMERLEGSLRDKLDSYLKKKRHPPLIQALTWIRDVAMGISECHDANVVHSDLKAANALLSKKNEAKLCDLGAGRVTRDMTATSSMINSTGGGIIRGSLPWLSSELLDDQSLQPSKASDVYAWACVCWEILSCRIPYHDEEGVLAIDLNKLKNLSAIVNGKLRPDLSVLRADAPSSIVEMMKRAWDPEPRDRPQIGEILETLESALSSFKDAKKGNSRRAAEAAAADLRSSALLTQASKAEEEDAKKAGEDLKALTKSLEEARALRIATIKKRHDEAALQMRIDLEAEEKKLEEEARREMALEIEKNETMLAQRKAKWIGEVNEKKEERLRNAHLLDEKDRARIVAEFEVENRDVEKRIEAARIEQTSRLETRLKERKEAKAKAAQKALLKLDDEAEIAVEEEKNKDVHDFLLD